MPNRNTKNECSKANRKTLFGFFMAGPTPQGAGLFCVLSRGGATKHLCGMLTNLYTRSTPLSAVVADSAKDIMRLLLQRQAAIASMDYNRRRSPHLSDLLTGMQAQVDRTDDEVQIQLNYPATIRFLDLKKTKYGKKKRVYSPIYNRPLFGHLYGRGYSLSNAVNMAIQQEYRNYFANLQNVMKTIDLL